MILTGLRHPGKKGEGEDGLPIVQEWRNLSPGLALSSTEPEWGQGCVWRGLKQKAQHAQANVGLAVILRTKLFPLKGSQPFLLKARGSPVSPHGRVGRQ